MGLGIEFAVKLTHRDGLGVENVGLNRGERVTARLGLILQFRAGVFQNFITLKVDMQRKAHIRV